MRLGYSRGYLAQIERGERLPPMSFLAAFKRELPKSFAEIRERYTGVDAPAQSSGLTPGAFQSGSRRGSISERDGDESREGLLAAAIANAASSIGLDKAHARDLLELADTEMQQLAKLYPLVPAGALLGRLVRVQGLVLKLVGESVLLEDPRRFFLAGVVEGLLGKACHDLGNPWQALVHLGIAAHLADQAGDRSLLAWVFINESLVSYWADMQERALSSAIAAVTASPPSSTAHVWAVASQARALALAGEKQETIRLISTLDSLREMVHPSEGELDLIGGQLKFTVRRQIYYAAEAEAMVMNGEPDVVARALEAMQANSVPDEEYSFADEACARAALALSYVKANEFEAATSALAPVLEAAVSLRIYAVRRCVMRVANALPALDNPEVLVLRGRIEPFSYRDGGRDLDFLPEKSHLLYEYQ
jgi:hypothetical protein